MSLPMKETEKKGNKKKENDLTWKRHTYNQLIFNVMRVCKCDQIN
jgi:hypothetical protein